MDVKPDVVVSGNAGCSLQLQAKLKEAGHNVAVLHPMELLELTITCGFCVGIGRAFQVLDIARDFDVLWSREPKAD